MFWEDDNGAAEALDVGEVVDIAFRIGCPVIPADHAHALGELLASELPWLREEAHAGVHTIHGPPSGNGWMRPDDQAADALLHLSRRSRLHLRVPAHRLEETRALADRTLALGEFSIEVGEATVKRLEPLPTLFARYVVCEADIDENDEVAFLAWVAEEIRRLGIRARKLMCGRSHTLRTPEGGLFVRSVMVADLDKEASLTLQREGLGPRRHMGCGLFIPHKGIAALSDAPAKES